MKKFYSSSKKFLVIMLAMMTLCVCALGGCGKTAAPAEGANNEQANKPADETISAENTADSTVSNTEDNAESNTTNNTTSNTTEPVAEEPYTIRVGAMSGPTGMGMVKLMEDAGEGKVENTYEFAEFATDASALVAPIAKGELDIAAVPSNLAANIYNNNDGAVEVVAACVLGVLNLVERGEAISSITDLEGKTVYATGQGAVPEYVIRYILNGNGLNPDTDVNIVWCADTTEALSYLNTVDGAIAVLPQPFVTAASAKVENLRIVMDLNDAWDALNPGCSIVTGVIVARKDFAEAHPQALNRFLEEYSASVDYVGEDVDGAAALTVKYGIVAAEGIAKKALPGCHIVCLTGSDLRSALEGFLEVIFEMNPKAVGGVLPGDDFYFMQ